jgi:hypothetical protein
MTAVPGTLEEGKGGGEEASGDEYPYLQTVCMGLPYKFGYGTKISARPSQGKTLEKERPQTVQQCPNYLQRINFKIFKKIF